MLTFTKVTFSIKYQATPCIRDEEPRVKFPAGSGTFFYLPSNSIRLWGFYLPLSQ